MSIYGVELLSDNANECRQRLLIFGIKNIQNCKIANDECRDVVKFILGRNILCGNALTMLTDDGEPIIFSEWSLVSGDKIKRRDFRLDVLLKENDDDSNYSMNFSLLRTMRITMSIGKRSDY